LFYRYQPFNNNLSTVSRISNILATPKYHNKTNAVLNTANLAPASTPNLLEFVTPNYATKFLKLWLLASVEEKHQSTSLPTNNAFQKRKQIPFAPSTDTILMKSLKALNNFNPLK
jgi:hypothetical protein